MKYPTAVMLLMLLCAAPARGAAAGKNAPVYKRPAARSATIVLNGNVLSAPGWIINGRTNVPLRETFTHLGARVWYDDTSGNIEIEFRRVRINMTVGDISMVVTRDGGLIQLIQMDNPPIVAYGRAYIPVRYVINEMGLHLEWDPSTRTVLLTKWRQRYEPFW